MQLFSTRLRLRLGPMCNAVHQRERNVLHVLLYRLPSKYFRGPLYRHECTVHTVQKGQDVMNFPATKPHQKYAFVLRFCTLPKWVPFAFYLNAFLHLAMDVTPACEHCRTSIWNVLWRNPISGFNGSSEAAHPGSCEIYALVKLVYSINFPIFNYWHYCCACYCFFAQNVLNQFWVDQSWGQLMRLRISWWDLH